MSNPDVAVVIAGLRDYDIFDRVKDQLKSQWFPTSDIRSVYEAIRRCHEEHPGRKIPWQDLKTLLRGEKGYDKVENLERRADGTSKQVQMKTLASFLEQQLIEDLAQDLARSSENGNRINHSEYIRRLEAAQRAGSLSVARRSIFQEEPKQWIASIESVPVVPLPSHELTEALRGGIAGGRPTTVLTRTDGGKTSFAVACGAYAVSKGLRVLHFTFEDSSDEVFRRYSCSWTKHTWDWVKCHPNKTQRIHVNVQKAGGDLEVVDFSASEASLADIGLAAGRAKRLWGQIDLIIIDSGDDVQSTTKTELKTEQIGEVWQGLTRLSRRYDDCPVMVTTQTNRIGAGARAIELIHVAEGWKKATVSSAVLVFDVPKDSKRGTISIVKTKRKGFYPSIPIFFDRERCVVR